MTPTSTPKPDVDAGVVKCGFNKARRRPTLLTALNDDRRPALSKFFYVQNCADENGSRPVWGDFFLLYVRTCTVPPPSEYNQTN